MARRRQGTGDYHGGSTVVSSDFGFSKLEANSFLPPKQRTKKYDMGWYERTLKWIEAEKHEPKKRKRR